MGNSIPNFELLQRNRIDFVEDVDTWDVNSVTLNSIDQIVWGGVARESDISVDQLVLFANSSDLKIKAKVTRSSLR